MAWRPVLLALCALTLLVQVAGIFNATGVGGAPPWQSSLGANTSASSTPFNLVVTSVDRDGPAARAGLRRADLIDFRANTLVERYYLFGTPLNGQPVSLLVRSGTLRRSITVTPRAPKLAWNFWLATFASIWLVLFATLLAWRGADQPMMRLLSLWIVSLGFTGAIINLATPWAWVYVLQNVATSVVGPLSVAFLAAFASGFAQPLSRLRSFTQWLCYAFLAIYTGISLVGTVGLITLRFDPTSLIAGSAGLVSVAAAILLAVLCGLLAVAASRGIERQRAVWTLVPLAAFFCVFIVGLFATTSSSYADTIVVGIVSALVLLMASVALTYASLSRRLIDVGFFLNRAAVFTIVSAIVIGAFILVEWAASAWLANAAHITSAFVGMLVALGLGVSLRYIHEYVERFVDLVFFRKRNEDESALRRFAHEASYISDRFTLLERAAQTVKEHTGAEEVAIIAGDGEAAYAFPLNGRGAHVSENDPGIVALRAWNKPIDLHAFPESQLRGEFAFPMTSRGSLVGALICGPKRDGESYAPDEWDALLALAHGVGTALDTLSSHTDSAIEAIRETQGLVLKELQKLNAHFADGPSGAVDGHR